MSLFDLSFGSDSDDFFLDIFWKICYILLLTIVMHGEENFYLLL